MTRAYFNFCLSAINCRPKKAAMRFPVILAVAAFALAGCNANQAVNPSSQPPSQVFAGHYEAANPYNPISYAQNNTGRGGGR